MKSLPCQVYNPESFKLLPQASLPVYKQGRFYRGFDLHTPQALPYYFQDLVMTTGRNEPCPCGSGKKYKKCCEAAGTAGALPEFASTGEYVALNRAIAYRGKPGKAREDFCRMYIARKRAALKQIERDQIEKVTAAGEVITCQKGCSNCCTQYILGTLQECDAIVYYLYQHEDVLADFVRTYPVWRAKVRQNEPIFRSMKDAVDRQIREGVTEANTQAYDAANVRFMMLNHPCPFLKDGACSIHEVRPWNCAKPVVTTPPQWCHPSTNTRNEAPRVYVSELVPEETPYFRFTKALNVMLVHLGVWEILTGGYSWLTGIPGLETLGKDSMADPDTQATIERFFSRR